MKTSNKKYLIPLLIIILIVIFLIIIKKQTKTEIYTNENNVEEKTPENTEVVVVDSYEIRKIVTNENLYTNIDISYPYFKKADVAFNLKIEDFIKDRIENHKVVSEENWKARYETQTDNSNINPTPNEENKFYLHSNFEVIQSNPNYISFLLKIDSYEGGAHGYVVNVPFNYDVRNKKILLLRDLFSEKIDFLKYLSDESRNYLKREYITSSEGNEDSYEKSLLEMIEIGTEPKEENFEVFTFTKDKIKIYFAQYQVGPYVIGMPSFEVNRK
ncbi:MAG: DUF4163 domain-containing protein [Candidatus Pacebacteria bacterium]|nr:DUF4163 domain-containing protein [Candidatus Paceibacterota bacterium]